MAAAAHFAAQAQDVDDEALELIAEFVIAVTLTDNQESVSPLPHAVMAMARLLFARDELNVARAEVRKKGRVDEWDARERAEKTVARFFAEVEGGASIGSGDQTLKPIQGRRIWRADYTTGMARLIPRGGSDGSVSGSSPRSFRRSTSVARRLTSRCCCCGVAAKSVSDTRASVHP
jgi:hypothetical protein